MGVRIGLTNPVALDILKIYSKEISMTTRTLSNQIAFRYRTADSASGITRETAKRLAEHLGVDETQAIHHALRELAIKLLPQYAPDDGPLTASQVRQIRKQVHEDALPEQGSKRSVRSSLLAPVSS
jgi:hypothetical protein